MIDNDNNISIENSIYMESMAGKLMNTDLFFYKEITRWYSKTFSTPLHVVREGKLVTWGEVLSEYYENLMSDYNRVYDSAMKFLPDLKEEEDQSLNEFIKILEKKQEYMLKSKGKQEEIKMKKIKSANIKFNDSEEIVD